VGEAYHGALPLDAPLFQINSVLHYRDRHGADGMGVVLESTRLAAREIARGDLVEMLSDAFVRFERETHFLSYRKNEFRHEKVALFRQWLLESVDVEIR